MILFEGYFVFAIVLFGVSDRHSFGPKVIYLEFFFMSINFFNSKNLFLTESKSPHSLSVLPKMATSLARQLQAIRSDTVATLDKRKHDKVASLLFDPQEAAEQDFNSVYALALNGLHGLIQINPEYKQYAKTLFAQTSKEIDRSVQVPTLQFLGAYF